MFLYNLPIVGSQAIGHALVGNFSGSSAQEILVSRGTDELELICPDVKTGRIDSLCRAPVFGVIRSLSSFRLTGESKDYIAMGSDSGRLVILEYDVDKRKFVKVLQETMGKTGCTRAIPGQYVVCDPNGRAIMIGAFEKQKFAYMISRDSKAKLKITSPLESNASYTIFFALCALDTGFENPLFAVIEADYSTADEQVLEEDEAEFMTKKVLVYYELDLGLNNILRKYSVPLDITAHKLVPVPITKEFPGGLLVCCHDFIMYFNPANPSLSLKISIPKRKDTVGSVMIISASVFTSKSQFFVLLQNELGDLFKLTFVLEQSAVVDIQLRYFDTIAPSESLIIIKAGFLFAACCRGTSFLFQIVALADAMPVLATKDTCSHYEPTYLSNLFLVHNLSSLASIVDGRVGNYFGSSAPEFLTLTAAGPLSRLNLSRYGIEGTEVASTELPATPLRIWSFKEHNQDEYHAFIAVAFVNATAVLRVGDDITEVPDSGFLSNQVTQFVHQFWDSSVIQVTDKVVRHIKAADKSVTEWTSASLIKMAAANTHQLMLALSSNELVYFVLESAGLVEMAERKKVSSAVTTMCLEPVEEGRLRSKFVAIACEDSTLRIYTLEQETLIDTSITVLGDVANSVFLARRNEASEEAGLVAHVGLRNSVYLIYSLAFNGQLVEGETPRMRYLGGTSLKFHRRSSGSFLLSCGWSNMIFLEHGHQNKLSPVIIDSGDVSSPMADLTEFNSAESRGFILIGGNELKIFSVSGDGDTSGLVTKSLALRCPPKKILPLNCPATSEEGPGPCLVAILETGPSYDNRAMITSSSSSSFTKAEGLSNTAMDIENGDEDEEQKDEQIFKRLHGPYDEQGLFQSLVQFVSLHNGDLKVIEDLDFPPGEIICAGAFMAFHDKPGMYLVISVKTASTPKPSSFIYTFQMTSQKPTLIHKTDVSDVGVALSLCPYHGRVLVGFSPFYEATEEHQSSSSLSSLRMYDLGLKKLLLKCHTSLPSCAGLLKIEVPSPSNSYRIIVTDVKESLTFLTYRPAENAFLLIADDVGQRWSAASLCLDYNTAVVADKFGQVSVLRLQSSLSHEIDYDDTGSKLLNPTNPVLIGSAPYKLDTIIEHYVGDTVLAFDKIALVANATPSLLYFTLGGSIHALIPLASRSELFFFQKLELLLRDYFTKGTDRPLHSSASSQDGSGGLSALHSLGILGLAGNEHVRYRSSFQPVRNCIDGSLIQAFGTLSSGVQHAIAHELDLKPSQILRKIDDFRLLHVGF